MTETCTHIMLVKAEKLQYKMNEVNLKRRI